MGKWEFFKKFKRENRRSVCSAGRRAVSPVRELVTKMLVNFVDTITRINLCLFCYKTNQASVGGRPENFISTWIVRRFRNKFVRIQPWF